MHIDIVNKSPSTFRTLIWKKKKYTCISKEDDSISDKGASKFYYGIYIIWSWENPTSK